MYISSDHEKFSGGRDAPGPGAYKINSLTGKPVVAGLQKSGAAWGFGTSKRFSDEFKRTRRFGHPMSLLMVDVDHFKHINDTQGHQVGDKLLVNLVKVLEANVRKTDLVARYGGEEFVVVFPGAGIDDAERISDALRQAVFDYGVEHADEYNRTPISISIGVAQVAAVEDGLLVALRSGELALVPDLPNAGPAFPPVPVADHPDDGHPPVPGVTVDEPDGESPPVKNALVHMVAPAGNPGILVSAVAARPR